MKRTVSITFDIDPSEYHLATDSAEGATDLVYDILRGYVDYPPGKLTIACQGETKIVDTNLL